LAEVLQKASLLCAKVSGETDHWLSVSAKGVPLIEVLSEKRELVIRESSVESWTSSLPARSHTFCSLVPHTTNTIVEES
jgi:hypothetical protein